MEVILLKDVKGVGKKGELVNAKEGYAKNFIIGRGFGVAATEDAKNKMKSQNDKKTRDEEKLIEVANSKKELINNKSITVFAKVGTDGKIFGSISNKDLVTVIKKEFDLVVEKKKITLAPNHIKQTGIYNAKIKIYKNIIADIKVKVEGR